MLKEAETQGSEYQNMQHDIPKYDENGVSHKGKGKGAKRSAGGLFESGEVKTDGLLFN